MYNKSDFGIKKEIFRGENTGNSVILHKKIFIIKIFTVNKKPIPKKRNRSVIIFSIRGICNGFYDLHMSKYLCVYYLIMLYSRNKDILSPPNFTASARVLPLLPEFLMYVKNLCTQAIGKSKLLFFKYR